MSKIKLIGLGLFLVVLSGCSSSGSSDSSGGGNTPEPEPGYRIQMDGSPYRMNLPIDSKVIDSMHCVNVALYDLNGNFVSTSGTVTQGDYLLEVTRKFTNTPEYDDSKGAFYSLGVGYSIAELSLDTIYGVPTRTRDVYKFNVSVDETFIVTTNESNINIYDENLTLIESQASVFTLVQGTYYIQTLNYACYSSDGSFSISAY